MLDISAEILEIEIVKIKKTKFLHNIAPQSILDFEVACKENTFKIIVRQNEQKVAELHYEKE